MVSVVRTVSHRYLAIRRRFALLYLDVPALGNALGIPSTSALRCVRNMKPLAKARIVPSPESWRVLVRVVTPRKAESCILITRLCGVLRCGRGVCCGAGQIRLPRAIAVLVQVLAIGSAAIPSMTNDRSLACQTGPIRRKRRTVAVGGRFVAADREAEQARASSAGCVAGPASISSLALAC